MEKHTLQSNKFYKKNLPQIDMINRKELISILGITLVLGIVISLVQTWNLFVIICIAIFGLIALNILAKKISGFFLETEVEIKIWELKKYG